jgi:starch synthase
MLRGRPEIWVRACWNRLGARGSLRPVTARLAPVLPGGLGFFKATIEVQGPAVGFAVRLR